MSDAEIFGKLSRLFETHGLDGNGLDEDLDGLLAELENEDYDFPSSPQKNQGWTTVDRQGSSTSPRVNRPTPYEVYLESKKPTRTARSAKVNMQSKKLTSEQWDRLTNKMHRSNRDKQSALIKEQNQGLAHELGGALFKPRINKTSLDLSATMKSLQMRMPEMLLERQKIMESKLREKEANLEAECPFKPQRIPTSFDLQLKKNGRTKVTPDDLIRYEEERKKRIEMRRQILSDMEAREETFKPRISEKSIALQQRLVNRGIIADNHLARTSTTTIRPSKHMKTMENLNATTTGNEYYEEGPKLIIESEHPYRHNTNEYTTVQVPGAVSYMVSFDERTRTEQIYDFVKFYDDETHTEYFGAGKYSGGTRGTSSNWPGVGGRPPLHIPHGKFIIHFKTNGAINDWGFAIHIVPTLLITNNDPNFKDNSGIPYVSDAGRSFRNDEPVHERLYRHALVKQVEEHNQRVDNIQNKLNITLKPWEQPRPMHSTISGEDVPAHAFVKMNNKTHHSKQQLSDIVAELTLPTPPEGILAKRAFVATPAWTEDSDLNGKASVTLGEKRTGPAVCIIEYDDSLASLWKHLRTL